MVAEPIRRVGGRRQTMREAEIDREEFNGLLRQLAPIIRDYLQDAQDKRGPDPINSFTVLNALAICAALPLNGAPDEVYDWFIEALDTARCDLDLQARLNGH
ncbi:hypothetical protein [Bradyrhizobium sp. Leo170]|uniref:hypothetical protein n=2 Tax=Bradyrhizobium TaxID=374 RepID=UPI00102E60FF|nr:hypothetical protein [Bradyrhizobium sp. Leo170]